MLRAIDVSTSVYAAIWAARADGEETENQILERLFNSKRVDENSTHQAAAPKSGVFDRRNLVNFPAGFTISREYKGKTYAAEARDGKWVRLDNGKRFPTLNRLNSSIAAGAENVWNGSWTYKDSGGNIRSIDTLRKS